MKKKGFTLIELLAVIVILAIIAVITVPKIADMISSSRQGGAEDSFYGTLKAAELGYTKALQSNTNLKGSTCTIEDSKITCANGVKIDVSGKTPESGTLVIETDGSTIAKGLTLNGYKCYGDLSTSNPCVKSDVDVASETLIKKVTTSGDGLYKDTYDAGRYIFRGSNPNNYLTFNDENWRIVSVESDGTLKIIKDEKLPENKPFDSRDSETTGRRFNSNNTYCKASSDGKYYGCNAWSVVQGTFLNSSHKGTVNQNASLNDYLNGEYYNGLSQKSKSQIQAHKFMYGFLVYGQNFENSIKTQNNNSWNGNISLLNISDWFKASNNNECTGTTNDWWSGEKTHNDYKCSLDNYLYKSGYWNWWWLISPGGNTTTNSIYIGSEGDVNTGFTYNSGAVHPVIHLKANLQLTGSGTSVDPYKIK